MVNKILLLLALTITSITTLSLPNTHGELNRRGTWPWMRCFEPTDTNCRMDDHEPQRPRKTGLNFCTAISLTTPRIGMRTFQTPLRLECEKDFRLHLQKPGFNQILIPDVFSYSDDTDIKFQEEVGLATRGTRTISESTRTNIVVGPQPFSITGLELRPVFVGNWMTVIHGRSGSALLAYQRRGLVRHVVFGVAYDIVGRSVMAFI